MKGRKVDFGFQQNACTGKLVLNPAQAGWVCQDLYLGAHEWNSSSFQDIFAFLV